MSLFPTKIHSLRQYDIAGAGGVLLDLVSVSQEWAELFNSKSLPVGQAAIWESVGLPVNGFEWRWVQSFLTDFNENEVRGRGSKA